MFTSADGNTLDSGVYTLDRYQPTPQGGAIWCQEAHITRCLFKHSSAAEGGVLYAQSATIADTNFFNTTSTKHGGAVCAVTTDVIRSKFESCSATTTGGAIEGLNITIKDSSITAATAKTNGG